MSERLNWRQKCLSLRLLVLLVFVSFSLGFSKADLGTRIWDKSFICEAILENTCGEAGKGDRKGKTANEGCVIVQATNSGQLRLRDMV